MINSSIFAVLYLANNLLLFFLFDVILATFVINTITVEIMLIIRGNSPELRVAI